MTPKPVSSLFLRWRRLIAVVVLLAALLVPAGLFLPDQGLRWGVVRGLVDLGWDRAEVAQAKLSLWKGRVAIRGMQAVTALGEALGIDGIDVVFRWKPLLSRRLSLEHLALDKAEVVLTRDGAGWRINGLPLPGGGDAGAVSVWGWGATTVTLTDSVLRVEDGPLRLAIAIDRLELRDLQSWAPDQPATLSLKGRVNDAAVSVDGTFSPFAPTLDFALDLKMVGLDTAPFAQWGGLPGWGGTLDAALRLTGGMGGGAPMAAEGRLVLAKGMIPLDGGKVAAAKLSWQGRVEWRGGIHAAGTLDGDSLGFSQGQASIAAASAHMRVDAARLDAALERLDWTGLLEARDWALRMDGLEVDHRALSWRGETQLNLGAKARTLFSAKGQADGTGTVIAFEDWRFQAARSVADGEFAHDHPQGILPPVAGTLTLRVEGLAARQGDRDWMLADRAEFSELGLSGGALTVGRMQALGVSALGRGKQYGPRLKARALTLEKLRLDAGGDLEVGALALAQPVLRISRDHAGIQGLSDLLRDKAAEDAPAAAPRRLALGRLRVVGGQVEFRDRTTPDPVRLSLRDLSLSLAGVDNQRPDQDSPFSLTAGIGAAELSAQGDIRPFRPIPGLDAKVSVRALDLPPLSPYAAQALGVNLHTGQLDAQVGLTVRDGTLEGKMDLVLARLRVAQPDPNAPLAKQADMPVETVLDLLRDGDDRITLSIPVRGDLDNPSFDTSDAVNQAIGGALRSTMFTTLKVAFPLVGLIGMVIDEAERPVLALQAVDFAQGSAELGDAQAQDLGKVAALMAERSGLGLNLCGVAVAATDGPVLRREASLVARLKALIAEKDREELAEFERERLRRLADSRAQAVKAWLVDEAGIDAGRLFTCRPRVDDDAKARPRVDLVL